MKKEQVEELTIHKIVAGSRLYGFATPESDYDHRGVCLSPVPALLGLQEFKQYQETGNADVCIYELRRFCHLALQANPNILDILFAPPETWLIPSPIWEEIYGIRHLFLSQKVRKTFAGYAVSQLKRIQRHREWIENPPAHKPTQGEYGAFYQVDDQGQTIWNFPSVGAGLQYQRDLKRWNQYEEWKQNRNPKRLVLEMKHGYDTKHAAHLVRLLLQVDDILRTGTYNPILSGQNLCMVKTVKNGEMSYQALLIWAEDALDTLKNKSSILRMKPD